MIVVFFIILVVLFASLFSRSLDRDLKRMTREMEYSTRKIKELTMDKNRKERAKYLDESHKYCRSCGGKLRVVGGVITRGYSTKTGNPYDFKQKYQCENYNFWNIFQAHDRYMRKWDTDGWVDYEFI